MFLLQTSLENFVLHQFYYQTCSTSIITIGIVALAAIDMDVTTTTTAQVNKLGINPSFLFVVVERMANKLGIHDTIYKKPTGIC